MRSRGRLVIGAASALVVAALWVGVLATHGRTADGDRTHDSAGPPAAASAFTVDHVLDGDTLEAVPGDSAARELAGTDGPVRVRLVGLDTPERHPEPECGADVARDRLRELVPEGATVWGAADREVRDRYDRLLLYVWTDDGAFVNAVLLEEGLAEALPIAPNTAHAERFAALEDRARRAGAGRWGACT